MYSVSDETRKPIFEGVQGENESREIQFDVTAWVEELGEGVCTATAKRPTDTTPYPVTVTRSGNVVTWKPNSTDTSIEGIGAFQLAFSINDVVAKTRIWNTKIAPSLVGAGDPPDPYDDWIQDLRDIAAETLTYSQNAANSADDAEAEKLESEAWAKGTKNGTPVPSTADQYQNNAKYFAEESYKNAEAWAVGQRGGVDVPSTDPTYENNAKYWAEQSLANQYGAFIVKSASGDIASFNDGADNVPMKSLKVAIVPKQAGSGDPSPSNVRPITGTSTANVFVTGVNLLNPSAVNVGKYWSDAGVLTSLANQWCSEKIVAKAGESYYFSAVPNHGVLVKWFTESMELISKVTIPLSDQARRYTAPAGTMYMCINVDADITTGFYVNYPSTDTEYHPYTGHTTPVPLGQTVYGGSVDVISGELVIDRAITTVGVLNWSYINGICYASVSGKKAGNNNVICDSYATSNVTDWSSVEDKHIVGNTANSYVYVKDTTYTSAEAFKSAMGSAQICYELANPITVQLTPAEVRTLLGQNNVWSDAGSVAVEYRADPTLAYNELANVIVSLGGNI